MAESGEETERKITVTVKTPKEKQEIEVEGEASVKEFKELVSQKFNAPDEQLCLIFAGKILKDGDSLAQHGIKDGLTVHLVIKSANRGNEEVRLIELFQGGTSSGASETTSGASGTRTSSTSGANANVGATPFGIGGLGGLAGLGNLGMGSANFMEMQQRMQRELMQNPEMFRSMMENPFVQQMMSNPEIMRRLITSNPQMRELMERNPEITHMLNNPELMRQTLELARNPAMLQELMRTQDRAMSNLESIPGGFNALQRMYRDIQEPMMNAAQEGFGSNPFASLVSNAAGNQANEQVGRENNDPLPNPWAPRGSGGSGGGGGGGSTAGGGGGPTQTDTTSGDTSTPLAGGPFGMFNSPGMQSLLTQMTQNPQLIQNMLQAPYIQTMMQTMSANPEMAQQILGSNPMFASNPQFQDTFFQYLPTMMNQIQNPQMQTLLSNPRALEAVMQIQQALQQLQNEAPGLFPGTTTNTTATTTTASSTTAAAGATTASETTTTTSTATTTTSSSSSTPATTTGSTRSGEGTNTTATPTTTTPLTGSSSNPTPNADAFSNLMAQMVQMMAGGQMSQPPETRFGPQLEQLAAMGFVDREANIRALTATLGDVNAAIDRLLQQR